MAAFGDVSATQHVALQSGACRLESARWKLETPRAQPADAGPSLLRAEFSSLMAVRASSLMGALKFDWAGLRRGMGDSSLRSERTAVSVGGLVRVIDNLSVHTNLGLEHAGAARTRATVSSVWRPSKMGVLFAEWAGSEAGTEAHRVGARWWLVPRHFAVELGARHLPDGAGWVDHRVGVALKLSL
ncbi:MAG: hypothetical protein H7Z15_21770 [Rhizobacter sp.]|nr:hypothetical protein [Rhizobacter sp.]